MPLTHAFEETIRARAQRDAGLREAPLQEAAETIADGDLATGTAALRDYVKTTAASQPAKRAPDR